MSLENRIVSTYNEDVEYIYDDMLLEQEDEMTESDIHIIEVFGKPYSIAMGKLKISDVDETLGHFICYLMYDKKVVRKLGIYETNMSANEMETVNHRTFNFEKEKLLLFDEYYEDTTKLQPFMYKKEKEDEEKEEEEKEEEEKEEEEEEKEKEDTIPKKTMIELKQGIKFEDNSEKQSQFLAELQERAKKYKPEKTQSVMNSYYKYLSYNFNILDSKNSHRREIQTKIKSPKFDNFKTEKTEKGNVIDLNKSKLFENMMKSDIKLETMELVVFEVLANVKIILVQNEDFDFNFLKYKENADFTKMNTLSIYSEFDPKDVVFVHKSVNEDEEISTNILLYNDKVINSFEELDLPLKSLILQKLNEERREMEHPMRFKYLKSLTDTIYKKDNGNVDETSKISLVKSNIPSLKIID